MSTDKKEKYDALKLDNQLCFPIYVCSKSIINKYTPFLNELDLTYTQYITMMVMWEERCVTSARLKERLFLDSGTLTPVLNRLVKKGYVTKQRSKEDARDLIITITEAGEQLKEKAADVPVKLSGCVSGIDNPLQLREDLRKLMKILTRD